jgi:hypothetical protein
MVLANEGLPGHLEVEICVILAVAGPAIHMPQGPVSCPQHKLLGERGQGLGFCMGSWGEIQHAMVHADAKPQPQMCVAWLVDGPAITSHWGVCVSWPSLHDLQHTKHSLAAGYHGTATHSQHPQTSNMLIHAHGGCGRSLWAG